MAHSEGNISLISAAALRAILPCARFFLLVPGSPPCEFERANSGEFRTSTYDDDQLKVSDGKKFAAICLNCSVFAQAVSQLPSDFLMKL